MSRAYEAGNVEQLMRLAMNALLEMNRVSQALERVRGAGRKRQQARRDNAGVITPTMRYAVLDRDGFRCVFCGACAEDGVRLAMDHVVAVANGGKSEIDNLQTLCDTCNLGKSDR